MRKLIPLLVVLLLVVLLWNATARKAAPAAPQYHTQTVTLATDPNTFSAEHVFDLGTGPHPIQVTVTGLTLNGDGETFGNNAGTIYVEPDLSSSPVNANYVGLQFVSCLRTGGPIGAGCAFEVQNLTQATDEVTMTARYLSVTTRIVSNDNGALYAGSNHPTAQVRVDLTYQ